MGMRRRGWKVVAPLGQDLPTLSGVLGWPDDPGPCDALRDPPARGRVPARPHEADDLGMYVVKFCGAGQGPRALVAEVICAEIAGALGLSVPRWVPVLVPEELAPAEPDEEVQHLLRLSVGMNLGIDFLPGALDVGPMPSVDPQLAGRIVWLDALITNVDLVMAQPQHAAVAPGAAAHRSRAALTFHHSWAPGRADQVQGFAHPGIRRGRSRFAQCAPDVAAADAEFADRDWAAVITAARSRRCPTQWLVADSAAWGGTRMLCGPHTVSSSPPASARAARGSRRWSRRSRAGRCAMPGDIGSRPGARGRRSGSPS